jgi:lysylphosphatidylglycerol synthetase-like protein (DUF2156 family)
MLALAFGPWRPAGNEGFSAGLGLAALWFGVLILTPERWNVLMGGFPGLTPRASEDIALIPAVLVWIALHGLIWRAKWRYGWIVHLLVGVPLGGLIALAAALTLGTWEHH